jgi:hypothetical protein
MRAITSQLVDMEQVFLYRSVMNMLQVIQRGAEETARRARDACPVPFAGPTRRWLPKSPAALWWDAKATTAP